LPLPRLQHTRAYLHYLIRANELTAKRLITLHNLTFMAELMRGMREAIAAGRFTSFAEQTLAGAP
jgi:queuine tRNA-ribosyltransferase